MSVILNQRSASKRRAASVYRSCVEALDRRQLFAYAVPADYVEVGSASVNSTSGAFVDIKSGGQAATLKSGVQYIAVGSGSIGIASDGRKGTVAQYQRQGDKQWVSNPKFGVQMAGVGWSGGQPANGDYVYGGTFTGNGAVAQAKLVDSPYNDNSGSFTVKIYQQVRVKSLTVADANSAASKKTLENAGSTDLDVTATSSSVSLKISGVVDPNPQGAGKAIWNLVDSKGTAVANGTLSESGQSASIDLTKRQVEFKLNAGVDKDGDGKLTAGETTHTANVHVKATWNQVVPEVFEKLSAILGATGEAGAKLMTLRQKVTATWGANDIVYRAYVKANAENADASLWSLMWNGGAVPEVTATTIGMLLQVPKITHMYQNSVIIRKGVQGMRGLPATTKGLINAASRIGIYGTIAQFAVGQGFNVVKIHQDANITNQLGELNVALTNLEGAIDSRFDGVDGSFANYAAMYESLDEKIITQAQADGAQQLLDQLSADLATIQQLNTQLDTWIGGVQTQLGNLESTLIDLLTSMRSGN